MGQSETIRVLWTIFAQLVGQGQVQVADLTQAVTLQVKDEIVGKVITGGLLFDSGRLGVISRVLCGLHL